MLQVLTIVRIETLVRWHRRGFTANKDSGITWDEPTFREYIKGSEGEDSG
jgi:hypothetical protein